MKLLPPESGTVNSMPALLNPYRTPFLVSGTPLLHLATLHHMFLAVIPLAMGRARIILTPGLEVWTYATLEGW